MKNANIITILVLIIGLGVGFFGGMKYEQSQVSKQGFAEGNSARRNFQGRMGQGNQPGRAVVGQILNQDDKSIIVKLADGSSKIVLLPDAATVSKTESGSKSDLKVGENVAVFGSNNADGSMIAQNIQLNPQFRALGSPSASPR